MSSFEKIPTPTNVTDVLKLIGLVTWYRRFMLNFTTSLAHSSDRETAFEAIKNRLTAAPILTYSNFELPFIVQTDASDFSLSAVLTEM